MSNSYLARVRATRALAFGLVLASTSAAGCSSSPDAAPVPELREGTVRVTTDRETAVDVTSLAPIKLGKNEIDVVPIQGGVELTAFSAVMPAHGHGSKPPVIEKTESGYRVRELILFMSGRWQMRLTFRHEGHDDEALLNVDVP